jgi:heterodisulfide reductase subunit A-like polyferredoxin
VTGDGRNGGPVGAVLVVGAGIGGMQASLDLAESGFKVYLTDAGPAIGGVMAQLDKTFPTNDCAMCIMSPKLVETGRHLNIDIRTMAEVDSLRGEAGDFTVRLRRRPRYVDLARCTGCGDCAAACPIVLPDEFNAGLSERRAISKRYPQAIPNAFVIEKRGTAPCRAACPIGQRAMGYVALIRRGRFADAWRTIREDNPFPAVCGRVCNHRCEEECTRRAHGESSVDIMRLKRFVADWARNNPDQTGQITPPADRVPEEAAARVAVVGSGPAGLTCARDLACRGHRVTVFEALSAPGGMMRVGIPAYRLPYDHLQRDIDDILAEGVELRLGHRVDDVPGLLERFDAVFAAVGAHRGLTLPIPGRDLPQVRVATDFLREVALGAPDLDAVRGKRVLVLGGGNVAIDAAMSAVRLGAAWTGMACLEDRASMPAHDREVRDAEEEGIQLFPARTFKEVIAQGERVVGVRTAAVNFRGFREGRPDFDERPDSLETIPCDLVVFAIGQQPDLSPLGDRVATVRGRTVAVHPGTMATTLPGLFAGGDAVTGTTFVVEAIAAGRRAARAVEAYLADRGCWPPAVESPEPGVVASPGEDEVETRLRATSSVPRAEPARRDARERRRDFGEVEAALGEAEAVREAGRCLECGICAECLQCVYACRAGAVDHGDRETVEELRVGAVILTPGLRTVSGRIRPEFGYGVHANVVTSLEFERLLSATGPTAGEVRRPSDGHHPRKVAFIQCVGSRDLTCGQDYCSSVCCMHATKEAIIAREHDGRIEPTIFFMDIRAYGKGFERYYQRAADEQGVRYVRSMVSAVREVPGSRNLRLLYATPGGKGVEEEFDLVVLSVGIRPSPGTEALAAKLGVRLNRFGFTQGHPHAPAETSVPGIFAAGAFASPKDIPETVIEASCAAAMAARLLAPARGTLTRQRHYPQERDVGGEEPRVGVFVCHCGINIGGVVRVPEVVDHLRRLPGVVFAEHNLYTCSQDTQERIKERIVREGINRVVVASCTPRTHEPLFQDTIRQVGLNPHLFELANIREQDSWVHRGNPDVATAKAKDLAAMAVAKAALLKPLYRRSLEMDHRALVVGGGLAGLTAALSIAEQGYQVHLVERETVLGGHLRRLRPAAGADGEGDGDPQALLADLVGRVGGHPGIRIRLGAVVEGTAGYVGQYTTTLRLADGAREEVGHGVAVVAVGARPHVPDGYLYGSHPDVLTQTELEERLADPAVVPPRSVVMIQCVGSRDERHPYCSRVCCGQAVENALALVRRSPATRVAILYRDIRTYGFRELRYREAREAGVLFLEYTPQRRPVVTPAEGGLRVEVGVEPGGAAEALAADWVVLSAGIEPSPANADLARIFKIPLSEDGFFLEAHAKLRPLEFAVDGIFLAGLAHSPRTVGETIAQANGAAVRAVTLLSRKELQSAAIIAAVNPRRCSACGICVDVCPYGARALDPDGGYAQVREVLCQGCGACVAACPNGASSQRGFEYAQVYAMIDAALTEG